MTPGFHDYGPITWIKRTPVYLTTILCAAMVVGMFVTVLLKTAGVDFSPLAFSTREFWLRGHLWQIVTYPFVALPDFFFLFNVLFFYMAGIEVEKFLGRSGFVKLYALLVFVPVLFFAAFSVVIGAAVGGINSSWLLTIGMFIAFATLYPDVEFWGWIPLKWFAGACLLLNFMMLLPEHRWIEMTLILLNCAAAFGFIRWVRRGGSFEIPAGIFKNIFRRKPQWRVVPKGGGAFSRRIPEEDEIESIDPLLDKISKHGINSLTARERERLERASKTIGRKQTGG